MTENLVCVKFNSLNENLEIEEENLEAILTSLTDQGFVTSVRIEDEKGYCLTESGVEYTRDWLRSLDIDVDNVTLEHLVEMLESTAPPKN